MCGGKPDFTAVVCSTTWRSVLLGAEVSQDREQWCNHDALKLCNNLTDDNVKALERVSLIKSVHS